MVELCKFGIHDLSAVQMDPATGLPRFNMPLELGLFLGCKRFGSPAQRKKVSLILDADQHRYRKFISDLSGQDIHSHGGTPENAIREVRNWLAVASQRRALPGGAEVLRRYHRFRQDLPQLCAAVKLEPSDLTFSDLSKMIIAWLRISR